MARPRRGSADAVSVSVGVSVVLICDRENRFGTCATRSWPAAPVEDAVSVAVEQGWLIGPLGMARSYVLCPWHAGATPMT